GAERQATAQALLGRGAVKLLPLFASGSKGLREQLHWVDKYHQTMNKHTLKDNLELIASQRELKIAWGGVQEQIAKVAIPLLLKLVPLMLDSAKAVADFIANMRKGQGTAGVFASIVTGIGKAFHWVGEQVV